MRILSLQIYLYPPLLAYTDLHPQLKTPQSPTPHAHPSRPDPTPTTPRRILHSALIPLHLCTTKPFILRPQLTTSTPPPQYTIPPLSLCNPYSITQPHNPHNIHSPDHHPASPTPTLTPLPASSPTQPTSHPQPTIPVPTSPERYHLYLSPHRPSLPLTPTP